MSNWFSICCGEGVEKRKASSFESVTYPGPITGKNDKDLMSSLTQSIQDSKARIQQREEQIALMNKSQAQRRGIICSKPIAECQLCSYTPPVFPKTDQEIAFIETLLRDNFLFTDLSDEDIRMLTLAMKIQHVQAGTKIIEQGGVGDFYYLVQSGQVDFMDKEDCVGHCTKGGSFGELALLYNAPRAVTCIAHSDATLWKVDQLTFRYIVAHNVNSQQQSMRASVKSLDVFANMPEGVVNRFVSAMTRVQWKKGDLIVQKGEEGKVFYIITEGRVKVYDIGLGDSIIDDQILEAGQGFGELSLLTGEPRAASVVAVTDVTTMAIDRATFEEHIGLMKNILEHNMRKRILKALPIFLHSNVTEPEIDHLVDLMVEVCYCKGEHLADAGKPYQMNLWIIRHGTVVAFSHHNPDQIFSLKSGDYFGDKSIKGDPTHIASFTAVCEKNVTALVLTREDIESVIGDIARLGESQCFVKARNEIRIRFEDLQKHRILGMGGFGVVWLVSPKNEKTPYALKAISKIKLLEANQVQSVMREKEMLRNLQHIFIVHLVASYQDENTLYLMLPVISGGELFRRVQKCKTRTRGLRNNDAAFYAACVIEAIGHFHHHNIAYRDLKLENILIGEDGYCVIVDLGFAKIVPDKTFTLVGTPEYIAPEIILSKGYDKSVDYWSYGVLVYELLVGVSPFFRFGSTRMDMFKRIVMVDFSFPVGLGEEAQGLVRKLLVRRPYQRLGNLANGYIDIKKSDWFDVSGVDFKTINQKTAEVPWKPIVKDPLKLKDFDSYQRRENEAGQGRPLTQEEQSLFSDF